MTYVLSSPHNVLDAQTAFVSMSLINLMGVPLAILPAALMFSVQVNSEEMHMKNFTQKYKHCYYHLVADCKKYYNNGSGSGISRSSVIVKVSLSAGYFLLKRNVIFIAHQQY